jgi:23S rRNA (pseudouridine1915-N3)-methyltransferase
MDNISEFTKRLSRYCKIQIIQIKKEKDMQKQKIRAGEHIVLVENGEGMTSESFAESIQNMEIHGVSNCSFYINCMPDGIDTKEFTISKFQIAPGLLGAILCEQIYRGYRIIHGQPYHK